VLTGSAGTDGNCISVNIVTHVDVTFFTENRPAISHLD